MGGDKFDENKLQYELIPLKPLREVAKVFTIGAKKYGDRNWEEGLKYSRCYGALQRHANAWFGGEDIDHENGQHHLAAVIANAMFLLEYQTTHPELDDRPKADSEET